MEIEPEYLQIIPKDQSLVPKTKSLVPKCKSLTPKFGGFFRNARTGDLIGQVQNYTHELKPFFIWFSKPLRIASEGVGGQEEGRWGGDDFKMVQNSHNEEEWKPKMN